MGSLDDDTAALVSLAERLSRVEPPVMRPVYAAELRTRLLTAAPELLDSSAPVDARTATPRRGSRQLRLRIAGATAIVVATGVGMGFASQGSLPGDPLYPVKQGIEKVQVATAGSLLDKGNQQLDQASTRLTEAQGLAQQGSSDPDTTIQIKSALFDFSNQAHDGTATLLKAYSDDHAEQAIVDLRTFTGRSVDTLTTLQTQVPQAALKSVGTAAYQMQADDAVAVEVCSSCTSQPALVLPSALAAIVPSSAGSAVLPGTTSPVTPTVAPTASSSSTDSSVSADPTAAVPSSLPPSVVVPPTASGATSGIPEGSSAPTTAGTTAPPPPVTVPDPSSSTSGNPTTEPPSSPPSSDPSTSIPPSDVSEPTQPPETTEPVEPPSSGLTSAPTISDSASPSSAPTF
ncbi:MAG: hypothetical protein QOD35_2818 [Nocardioidaceae bacterium]|jgi:hypothetical protein|nr:hypothetical protein [Nocardioidaceae bacterium]